MACPSSSASLSDIRTFMLCPKRLSLTRQRMGTEPDTGGVFKLGKLTGALNRIFGKSMSGSKVEWEDFVTSLDKQFPDSENRFLDKIYTDCARSLLHIFSLTIKRRYIPMMMQMPFALQMGVNGTIDYIFKNDKSLIAMWIKDSHEPNIIRRQSLKTTVYHLVAEQNLVYRGFTVDVIEMNTSGFHAVTKRPNDKVLRSARDRLRQVATLVQSRAITYPDFTHCRPCPYSSVCGP